MSQSIPGSRPKHDRLAGGLHIESSPDVEPRRRGVHRKVVSPLSPTKSTQAASHHAAPTSATSAASSATAPAAPPTATPTISPVRFGERGVRLIQRLDQTRESPLFRHVFALVAGGMLLDAFDVYLASAVTSAILADGWSTLQLNSLFLSAGFLGLFLGSLVSGFVGDLRGRRVAYQVNLAVFGGASLLSALAPNMGVLIVLRFIAGVGLGAEIVTGYALITEFAPVGHRGRWAAATSVVANCGAPVTLLVSTIVIPHLGWRPMFVIVGVLAAILWWLRRDVPESPRWLVAHGRLDEAESIIAELETGGRIEPTEARAHELVRRGSRGRMLLVASVAASATIICQYTFTTWVPTLLGRRGIGISGSLGLSTLMMVGAPLGCLLGAWAVDRIGRKPTIIAAFAATAVLGVAYAMQTSRVGVVVVGFVLTACFYVLMASVIAVYVAELFPTDWRFRGAGIANAVAKLLTVAMPVVVTAVLQVAPDWTIFAGISAIAAIACAVVWVWGPETNRRLLD
jgi:MFS transporter, putative metabolite:H+ symporter